MWVRQSRVSLHSTRATKNFEFFCASPRKPLKSHQTKTYPRALPRPYRSPASGSTEGAFMRRHNEGAALRGRYRVKPTSAMRRPRAGLGAGTREALASRPPALRPAAFNGWTRRRRRGAEARRIGGPVGPVAATSTAPGTEKPLVARRAAPRLRKEGAPLRNGRADRRANPSSSAEAGRRQKEYGRTRRPTKNAGAELWLLSASS